MALSTKDVAAEIGVSPRELRKFLRSADLGVGQGARYAFDSSDIEALRRRFADWRKAKVVLVRFDSDEDSADNEE